MPVVSELELPVFDYTDPSLRGERFHAAMRDLSEQGWLAHPLASGTTRSRVVETDGRLWTCMGPLMIDEIVRLRREIGR